MPAATVADYSGWRPDPRTLREAGFVGVVRYPYLGAGTEWKTIQRPEYQALLDAGLSVALTPELAKNTWRGGYAAGVTVGKMAGDWAHYLGHPDDRPLHFAVDEDVRPGELMLAMDYLHGCNDGRAVGIQSSYGESMVIDWAIANGVCCNGWRAAARAWDPGASKLGSIEQQITKSYPQFPPTAYDENIILKTDWGQHPAPQGEEVALTPYSLWRDVDGKVWRVDAGAQSKVYVPDQAQIDWNFAVLRFSGYPENQLQLGVVGSNATLKTWLDGVPDAATFARVAPPAPPVDSAAIAKAVLDSMATRLIS